MLREKNCSDEFARAVRMNIEILFWFSGTYAFIANQIASTTITTTIPPHTKGVTFFELPLRGESFGAWL